VSGRTENEKICQVKPKSKNLRAENQALSLELIGAKQKITDLEIPKFPLPRRICSRTLLKTRLEWDL